MSQGNMGGVFDATQVQPNGDGDFSAIPSGKYKSAIVGSEWKVNNAKTGRFLELTLEVVDGEFKGRKLWDRLNLENPSQQASDIAQKTLSAICHATGVLRVSDSQQLHDKPLLVTVRVVPRKDKDGNVVKGADGKDETSNEVKGYSKIDGGITALPVANNAPATAAAATTTAAPAVAPWNRQKAS